MKKEIADLWIADLRNPENKQAKNTLFDGKGYCCLGRLCVILGEEFKKDGDLYYIEDHTQSGEVIKLSGNLSNKIRKLSGLKTCIGEICKEGVLKEIVIDEIYIRNSQELTRPRSLTEANDGGATFLQIADWIEQNWESL